MGADTLTENLQTPTTATMDGTETEDSTHEARLRARRHGRLSGQEEKEDAHEDSGTPRRRRRAPAPTAGSLLWGGRLLRHEEEYRQHPVTWALCETLKKVSFVAVVLLLWHAGRRYTRGEHAAVVWTTDAGATLRSHRLAFVQGAPPRLALHRGDVVAVRTPAHAPRPVRAVVVDDTPTRTAHGALAWHVAPHGAGAGAEHAWVPQRDIVGRIDLSLSPLALPLFLVLFSLYSWWALSGY